MLRFPGFPLWEKNIILLCIISILACCSLSQNYHCSSNPCINGICLDDGNSSYSCYCIDGYTGLNCEINWDDCWSNPCLNGGICNDAVAAYNCSCPEGFIGINCEQKYSECLNQPCLNNGTCIDYNGFMCQCPEGYSGNYCEIDVSVCNDTICRNSGECIEGPGLSFSCQCAEGWTGRFCEEDINECLISPCQNGGLCINLPASYTCACLFGFTGRDCDKSVIPCEENLCENNAICLFEDYQPVCYCVPDYHGILCEMKYDDCESKNASCANGGTCIDGINDYTCACLPEYAGDLCTEFIGYGSSTTSETVFTENFSRPIEPEIISTDANQNTSASTEKFIVVSYPTNTSAPNTDYGRTRGISLETTTREFDTNLTSTHTLDINVIENGPVLSTNTNFSITTVRNLETTIDDSSYTDDNFNLTSIAITNVENETTSSPRENYTEGIPSQLSTNDESQLTQYSTEDYHEIEMFNANNTVYSEETTVSYETPEVETGISPTHILKTTKQIFESVNPSVTSIFITDQFNQSLTSPFNLDETAENFEGGITSEIATSTLESTSGTMILKPVITTEEITFTEFTDKFLRETSSSPSSKMTTGYSILETSSTEGSKRERAPYKCNIQECANTSRCLYNFTECDCNYEDNCKVSPNIKSAAFNGKSYIRQEVMLKNNTLEIEILFRTSLKNGILFHVLFDDERYVFLYLETGQLKFQFSCGLQSMLFGEVDSPVNNGFETDIVMRFQYSIDEKTDECSAKLLINNTVAMSGEQMLPSHEIVPQKAKLHLGGIPITLPHQFSPIALGFIGCIDSLKVNGVLKNFVTDSLEIFQVDECYSFSCLNNLCQNSGLCEEKNGKIHCKCPIGFTGEFCERSACDDNPCHLGATCISYPGTSFICICPLGMHGLFCDEDIVIIQPAFTVFMPGYSSYMAYGIPISVRDNMELKMRFIPHLVDQISLIAYLGQTVPRKHVTDHFSLTYVRGYIMLTWDLGSGVRRIFTKTPLDVKVHKTHYIWAGRRGKEAWLSVDGIENVTGQTYGSMSRLDVSPILYIGGHKSRNFESLPHDLPLHTGFSGCIYDIELHTNDKVLPVSQSSPATGRGIGECHSNECSHNSCKNGAICLNHGPTYSCICMKDWQGSDCSKSMKV